MPRSDRLLTNRFPPKNFPFDKIPPHALERIPFLERGPSLDVVASVFPSSGGILTVLLNNGFGDFSDVQTFADAPSRDIALGDIDGDGDLDVLRTVQREDSVAVIINEGDGEFSEAGRVELPALFGAGAEGVALGDLDGDGDLDAVVADGGEDVHVLENDGAGNFTIDSSISIGTKSQAVALGDLDGDGDIDAAVSASFDGSIAILNNDGTGTMDWVDTAFCSGEGIGTIIFADMDSDGDLDLVTECAEDESNLEISFNDGNGMFPEREAMVFDQSLSSFAVGDVDGDGDQDMVATFFVENELFVFLNEIVDGEPNFTLAQMLSLTDASFVQLGDVDGDGDLDALVSGPAGEDPGIAVLSNDGAGEFAQTDTILLDIPGEFAIGFLDEPVEPNSVPDPAGLLLA